MLSLSVCQFSKTETVETLTRGWRPDEKSESSNSNINYSTTHLKHGQLGPCRFYVVGFLLRFYLDFKDKLHLYHCCFLPMLRAVFFYFSMSIQ